MSIKKYTKIALLTCLFTQSAMAMTASPLSDDEMTAGICILATSGVHTAVSERQAGRDKAATGRLLDKELAALHSSFSSTQFLQGMADSWARALDSAYELPIEADADNKQVLISAVTKDAFVSCMQYLGRY